MTVARLTVHTGGLRFRCLIVTFVGLTVACERSPTTGSAIPLDAGKHFHANSPQPRASAMSNEDRAALERALEKIELIPHKTVR
jgi:hypothetical protein